MLRFTSLRKILDVGFDYVLPGNIQSDHLEEEFGICRCSFGGNNFIICQQIVTNLSVCRLKLDIRFDIHQSNNAERTFYLEDLESNYDDIELVEYCFSKSSCLNEEE